MGTGRTRHNWTELPEAGAIRVSWIVATLDRLDNASVLVKRNCFYYLCQRQCPLSCLPFDFTTYYVQLKRIAIFHQHMFSCNLSLHKPSKAQQAAVLLQFSSAVSKMLSSSTNGKDNTTIFIYDFTQCCRSFDCQLPPPILNSIVPLEMAISYAWLNLYYAFILAPPSSVTWPVVQVMTG